MAELSQVFAAHRESGQEPKIRGIIMVDGLRIIFEDGWGACVRVKHSRC